MMENLKDIEKEIDKITEVSGFEDPLQLLSSSKVNYPRTKDSWACKKPLAGFERLGD